MMQRLQHIVMWARKIQDCATRDVVADVVTLTSSHDAHMRNNTFAYFCDRPHCNSGVIN